MLDLLKKVVAKIQECNKRRQNSVARKLQVPLLKRWSYNRDVRLHSSTESDKRILDYATAWGIAMQQAIAEGKEISGIAKKLSHKVDNRMSGATYMLAVEFLCHFWVHGEELRKWHNEFVGGSVGKEVNKHRNMLINPTIIGAIKKK
jgi:hypothetical protein